MVCLPLVTNFFLHLPTFYFFLKTFKQKFVISVAPASLNGSENKYKVLAWNSRLRSPIDLTQYDIMTTSCHSWLVFSCIGRIWAHCSTFKYLANTCGSSLHRTSETLHLLQLHLYRSAMEWSCVLCGLFMLYVQQQYFLHAHSSMLWMYWQ